MDEIRDCKRRLVCMANAKTGLVEHVYKRCFTQTTIPVGGRYVIELEGTHTEITRISTTAFTVESHQMVA